MISTVTPEFATRNAYRASSVCSDIWNILDNVFDPELPGLTIWDLGILQDIKSAEEKIVVVVTPTYSGCPAVDTIIQYVHDNQINCFDTAQAYSFVLHQGPYKRMGPADSWEALEHIMIPYNLPETEGGAAVDPQCVLNFDPDKCPHISFPPDHKTPPPPNEMQTVYVPMLSHLVFNCLHYD